MNFPGHIKGAIIAGVAVGALAIASGHVELELSSLEDFIRNPVGTVDHNPMSDFGKNPMRDFLGLIFLSWFMALFPDLDTGSTPRKHYFRWILAIFCMLYIIGDLEFLAFVAIFSVTPLLHRHRGWTHWLVTPWILSILFAFALEYLRARDAIFFNTSFSFSNVFEFLWERWIFPAAFVIGHWTHLALDSEWIKKMPIIGLPGGKGSWSQKDNKKGDKQDTKQTKDAKSSGRSGNSKKKTNKKSR